MEYKYELHCHTGAVSRCGRVEPEKIVEMYVEAGYNGIVVTDHYSPMTFPIHRLACPKRRRIFTCPVIGGCKRRPRRALLCCWVWSCATTGPPTTT